jgi:hypothetical protein
MIKDERNASNCDRYYKDTDREEQSELKLPERTLSESATLEKIENVRFSYWVKGSCAVQRIGIGAIISAISVMIFATAILSRFARPFRHITRLNQFFASVFSDLKGKKPTLALRTRLPEDL